MYLNIHSQYSLRYGTMSIGKLVDEAIARGINQMVLTDINNSTGIMQFIRKCREKGVKPIGGIEFRKDNRLLYIGIARSKEGMRQLNEFLSYHNLEQKELPDEAPYLSEAYFVYPFGYKVELKKNHFWGIRYDQLHTLYGQDLKELRPKLLALQPVVFAERIEYRLHEYLRGIDLNSLLTMVAPEDKCRKPIIS
ncbi:PHP domain-containing protein [Pedobacter sp. PACM 27299]|uniref:PHP domain-containing protein n=1 Tax=Pedobacter sp. PACM 27299 TaxID=1727164 RepID=UPI000B132A25|nr:PHP domain-containing protein [Pedobacter sp. PACM 27299]